MMRNILVAISILLFSSSINAQSGCAETQDAIRQFRASQFELIFSAITGDGSTIIYWYNKNSNRIIVTLSPNPLIVCTVDTMNEVTFNRNALNIIINGNPA
jgi:hypothetical protein